MTANRSSNPNLIYTQAAFAEMMEHLWAHKVVALDTESDSLFSYYPKICLIQISTYSDAEADPNVVTDYLVDPLRFTALAPLGQLLADPTASVIIHAAENDIYLMQREFDFSVSNLFDTQLVARILGWPRAGLAAILEEQFGVVSNKKMQRTNWGKRPLTPEQIAYAQMDTHYLLALRERQTQELYERDRWEEAQEAFTQLTAVDYRERVASQRSVWQMKEARTVPHALTGVLEALWLWREQEAQSQDRPPFKIVNNPALVELAQRQPSSQNELREVRALSSSEIHRYGAALLEAIREGKQRPLPPLPETTPRYEQWLEKSTLDRFDALRDWRSKTAATRGVAPEIVLTNEILMEVAKRQPRTVEELREIEAIGPWKAKTYGADLLRLVRV
jgi:ribonuclease D